jgi:D-beta-D-heptose 7-phosphate kinase/D-beta-D-heptose 1-phosphate adenosyltransferase
VNQQHLIPCLERLNSATVASIGDIMLDRFIYGQVQRISPEAPIPVLSIQSQQSMLGGLGNVVRNLGALGCGIQLFSITGEDAAGDEIGALLKEVPFCQAYLLREASRKTPVKVRYIAHSQQLLRADHETVDGVSPEVFAGLLEQFRQHVDGCSVVFLSDYAKGVLKNSRARELIDVARAAGKPVVVDPKGRDFERYAGATVIKPNLKELAEAAGVPNLDSSTDPSMDQSIYANVDAQERAARVLLERTGAQFLLVTRGAAGMLLVPRDGQRSEFPSLAQEVYDVSGAGDTVAAVLAAALGSGSGIIEAVELANIAAGIVVGKVGTAVADRSEIIQEIEKDSAAAASGKILRFSEAVERVRYWRRMGRRIGFIKDSFNPLTPRHLQMLEHTRSRCDRLMAALTLPDHVKDHVKDNAKDHLIDGDQQARAFLLASLVYVDGVVICDSPSAAEQLQEAVAPDLLAPFPVSGANTGPTFGETALFEAAPRQQSDARSGPVRRPL